MIRARLMICLVTGLALLGCVANGGNSGATRGVKVQGGEIAVVPPPGYCVDPKASHESNGAAVVLMGRCNAGRQTAPVLITVSVAAPGSSAVLTSGAKALSDYFVSPLGRAALARDGRAASVRVKQTLLSQGALLLLIEDRAVGTYWRAVLGVKTRLVTLSVTAPKGQAVQTESGRALLDQAIAAMRRENEK